MKSTQSQVVIAERRERFLLPDRGAGALLSPVMAGRDMKEITPPAVGAAEKDWTVELGTGVLFSNVRRGPPNKGYTLIPIKPDGELEAG